MLFLHKQYSLARNMRVINLFRGKCPKCESGKVFKSKGMILFGRMPVMNTTCPNCKHKFEIETGFFFGAMFVSYAMAVAEAIGVFLIAFNFTKSALLLVFIIAVVSVLMSFVNLRYSRMIWMYLFTKKTI